MVQSNVIDLQMKKYERSFRNIIKQFGIEVFLETSLGLNFDDKELWILCKSIKNSIEFWEQDIDKMRKKDADLFDDDINYTCYKIKITRKILDKIESCYDKIDYPHIGYENDLARLTIKIKEEIKEKSIEGLDKELIEKFKSLCPGETTEEVLKIIENTDENNIKLNVTTMDCDFEEIMWFITYLEIGGMLGFVFSDKTDTMCWSKEDFPYVLELYKRFKDIDIAVANAMRYEEIKPLQILKDEINKYKF